jgi:hypothetical protein
MPEVGRPLRGDPRPRGRADALRDQAPPMQRMSPEIIRIHPERVISFGLEET